MEPELSSYTRKKLERPYMLHGFDNVDQFVRRLEKHGITVRKRNLEEYECEGWLQPAFRLVLPEELLQAALTWEWMSSYSSTRRDMWRFRGMATTRPGTASRRIPSVSDATGSCSITTRSRYFKSRIYSHYKSIPFLCRDSYTRSDIEKIVNRIDAGQVEVE